MKRGQHTVAWTLAAGLSAAATLVGSSTADAQDVVRFLHNETDPPSIEFYNKAIAEFEAQNPDIDIEMEAVDTDARIQKIFAALSSHTMPEIVKVLPEELSDFVDKGYVMPVDDVIDSIGRDDFVKGSIPTIDGVAYGVPYTMGNFNVLFYRKDLLEAKGVAVPTTWDELKAAAEVLTGDGTYGYVMGAGKNRWTDQSFAALVWAAGGTFFDENLNVTFDNPGTVAALEFLQEMAQYSPPGVSAYSYSDMINSYMTGKIALDIYAGRLPANIAANTPDLLDKTGVAPMPAGPSGIGVQTASADSFSLGSPAAGAQNIEAAKKFLEFLMTGDRLRDFSLTAFPHLIPPLKSVQPLVIEEGSKSLGGRTDFGEVAFDTPNGLNFNNEAGAKIVDGEMIPGIRNPYIQSVLARGIPSQVVQRVVLQGESPADAAAWGQAQMEAIVAEKKD